MVVELAYGVVVTTRKWHPYLWDTHPYIEKPTTLASHLKIVYSWVTPKVGCRT